MNAVLKRIFDVTLGSVALVVAAPVVGIIALIIWLESPGQVIFVQERVGVNGRSFRLYKFRKFPVNWGNAGPGVTVNGDIRMTCLGRFLERTKLDELPQLWNILKGEMSFVGPRPESKRFAHLFSGEYKAVLRYVPGIFGPSQVQYRNEGMLYPPDEDPETYYCRVIFPEKAKLDTDYYSKAYFYGDIGWIISGITVSIFGAINWKRIAARGEQLIVDAALIAVAWTIANYVRFLDIPKGPDFDAFVTGLTILPLVLMLCMNIGGCYRHPRWYFSAYDARRMFLVVSVGWLAGFLLLVWSSTRTASFSLLPIGWLHSLFLLAIPRIWLRIRKEPRRHVRPTLARKVLVYGAGRVGIALAEWMSYGSDSLRFIGFIDDNPDLRGNTVSGHRVLGWESDIPSVQKVYEFNEIWVTYRPDERKQSRLEQWCITNGIRLFILCGLEPFTECREKEVPRYGQAEVWLGDSERRLRNRRRWGPTEPYRAPIAVDKVGTSVSEGSRVEI